MQSFKSRRKQHYPVHHAMCVIEKKIYKNIEFVHFYSVLLYLVKVQETGTLGNTVFEDRG